MYSDGVWDIFEKTGSIDVYMLYNHLRRDAVLLSREQAAKQGQMRVSGAEPLSFPPTDRPQPGAAGTAGDIAPRSKGCPSECRSGPTA